MLRSKVEVDDITTALGNSFDYTFTGETTFTPPVMSGVPEQFGIGLIVGPSGSGKSTLLKSFGQEAQIVWDDRKAICSHFADAKDAQDRLAAVGLNSIPSWMKPYSVLSTGEKFRADLARRLVDGAVIDEFTSVVDRNVAKACSAAIRRYCDNNGVRNVVFATCHYDVSEWLQPDWIFDTNTGTLAGRGADRRRPSIELEILPATAEAWRIFGGHHYLNHSINKAGRCWMGVWNDRPVAFVSAITYPSGTVKNAWRGHRTVVLPDYQGLGIGMRISDYVGQLFVDQGCRYFSKTSHPRMGSYRNNSPLWRPTSKNMKARKDYNADRQTMEKAYKMKHAARVCFSHEYVGLTSNSDSDINK